MFVTHHSLAHPLASSSELVLVPSLDNNHIVSDQN